jgi:hypothetical protein
MALLTRSREQVQSDSHSQVLGLDAGSLWLQRACLSAGRGGINAEAMASFELEGLKE